MLPSAMVEGARRRTWLFVMHATGVTTQRWCVMACGRMDRGVLQVTYIGLTVWMSSSFRKRKVNPLLHGSDSDAIASCIGSEKPTFFLASKSELCRLGEDTHVSSEARIRKWRRRARRQRPGRRPAMPVSPPRPTCQPLPCRYGREAPRVESTTSASAVRTKFLDAASTKE